MLKHMGKGYRRMRTSGHQRRIEAPLRKCLNIFRNIINNQKPYRKKRQLIWSVQWRSSCDTLYRKSWRYKSRDSSVGIALGYGLDDLGSRVRFPAGAGNFSLHHSVQNGSEAHPASYPMDTRALTLRAKWSGREADHSPPSGAEVK
jgi:hypothetical protein